MRRILPTIGIFLFLTGCGTTENSPAVGVEEPVQMQLNHKENGMKLSAEITVGESIHVDAVLENTSDQTILYNGRCGIPFRIFVEMDGSNAALNSNIESTACEDIFDPNDLEEFRAGETIERAVTFAREFTFPGVNKENHSTAHNGDYKVYFSFQPHNVDQITAQYPITLLDNAEPDMITIEEAKALALEDEKVTHWYQEQQQAGLKVEAEEAILSTGSWHLPFYAKGEEIVYRIVVAIDFRSGNITDFNVDEIDRQFWEEAESTKME
ncbi:hypothetical protein [Gracilibacillus xinjiangensis]|uniref:PepSY domain-containing protein n=1 Tax=Gracilibacillus xinjiangensis TaxID=1193282 RepID=A0ABV8WV37_9BACI